jgi:DNA gyrase subunit B
MRPIIEAGHLYLAKPPLFALKQSQTKKIYAYSDAERDELLEGLINERKKRGIAVDEKEDPKKQAGLTDIQRYKGLGEMNADELWETTMNPENRVLIKVNIQDAEKADAIFSKLMGEDVELRKNFIQTRAKFVTDLDI